MWVEGLSLVGPPESDAAVCAGNPGDRAATVNRSGSEADNSGGCWPCCWSMPTRWSRAIVSSTSSGVTTLGPARVHTLQTLVSRLRGRRSVTSGWRPVRRAYRLRVATDEVDALRFEELVRVGLGSSERAGVRGPCSTKRSHSGEGRPTRSSRTRSSPVPEVALTGRAAHPCDRGTRRRCLLELGRPDEVIGELEAEIAVEPFRERCAVADVGAGAGRATRGVTPRA